MKNIIIFLGSPGPCSFFHAWWTVKWGWHDQIDQQSGAEDRAAPQVWVALPVAVFRWGVSLDHWLFTALFPEMEKRWHFYFVAVILLLLSAALGDTSFSSLPLTRCDVLIVSACSVRKLLFLLLLWEQLLDLSMFKVFCLHDNIFLFFPFMSSFLPSDNWVLAVMEESYHNVSSLFF